jgi:DNA polymerase-3 subunit alpha
MTDLELYFQYRCKKGLARRGLAGKPEYEERLKYEIETIQSMGYSAYFLIFQDIVNWAIFNGVPVGPGRGSAAGALVAYCLEITHLDPVKYGLIFERFLNPDRVSMPDIDMDFCELRRKDVIEYVEKKYGKDKVAHIGTYGSMKAKAAIRDVARTLGMPYIMGDKLAKMTLEPIAGKPQTLETCYEKVPELHNLRHGEPRDERTVLEWAERMENRIKTFGTHASGIVISANPVADVIPLYPGKEDAPTTQFEMNTVEEVGLIKFDFLALRALTTIKRCVDMVSERHGIDIDPLQIPVDDQETFQLLQTGDIAGVFQLEGSTGIRDLLVRIRPTCLEDIAILVAIYRPGPLSSDMLQHYLKVRAGEANPHYVIPELEPILKPTDGMLIYQEQILQICRDLAGYTMGEADLMRRAVGKKKEKEMAAQYKKFIQGMQQHGISTQNAEIVWKDIKTFADYGFNRAHAACYGYIGYQMAWLKTHHLLEFLCSCLISDSDEADKIIQYIAYGKEKEIEILSPSINESQYSFSVTGSGQSIRFGLSAIKNLGKPVQLIIEEREKNGPFKDILDFANRVDLSKINRRKLESLVLAGAFDGLSQNRSSLLETIESIQKHKEEKKRYESKLATYMKRMEAYEAREYTIFAWNSMTTEEQKTARQDGKKRPGRLKLPIKPENPEQPQLADVQEMSTQETLAYEKELLGYFVTGHPLDDVKESVPYTIGRIKEEVTSGTISSKFKTSLIAIPSTVKTITTKKDKRRMAYMALEDKTGTIQAVIVPNKYARYKDLIDVQTPALYSVELEVTEGDIGKTTKLIILRIGLLPSVQALVDRPIDLTVPLQSAKEAAQFITDNSGHGCKINLRIQSESSLWEAGTFSCVGKRSDLEKRLKELT